jgi:hypothetical protein
MAHNFIALLGDQIEAIGAVLKRHNFVGERLVRNFAGQRIEQSWCRSCKGLALRDEPGILRTGSTDAHALGA